MANLLSFVGPHGAPVNLELPQCFSPEQAAAIVMGTPPGAWCYLPAMVDGEEVRVHVRPDSFGMFFTHEK